MIVLITGANGFFGRELIARLLIEGVSIWVITSKKFSLEKDFGNKIRIFTQEDLNANSIPFEQVNSIVHCAFSTKEERKELADSLLFTQQVFSRGVAGKVAKIINLSTRSVYGADSDLHTDEGVAVSPINEYGSAKFASELMLGLATQNTATRYINLRLSSLIGKKTKKRVVNKFVKNALDNKAINIIGGKQNFSFMDIRDAVSAVILLLYDNSQHWNKTYNLGSNKQYTITELAQIVASEVKKATGKEIAVNVEEKDIMLTAGMDSSAFYRDFKWQPFFSIKDSVVSILNFQSFQLKP